MTSVAQRAAGIHPACLSLVPPLAQAAPETAPVHREPDPAPPAKPKQALFSQGRAGHDWRRIAELLAAGNSPEEVAPYAGLQPRRIRQQLRRSARLRKLVAYYGKEADGIALARLVGLRSTVAQGLVAMARHGDRTVLLFLAKHLNLFGIEAEDAIPAITERRLIDHWTRLARNRAYTAGRDRPAFFAGEDLPRKSVKSDTKMFQSAPSSAT
ncbi:MAG: hypothetical protein FJX47_09930 [Alphaproteobacteria bacterium]|nr:hypothetical protein [Alphaproteobacteria bacterium]